MDDLTHIKTRFAALYSGTPRVCASAPGRLEVLGNHTDYNAGLTLSCAVGLRCFAALSPAEGPAAKLVSTAFDRPPLSLSLEQAIAPRGDWTDYVLGLVGALQRRGHHVPAFELLVDSSVPPSAGVSSSAALCMSVLTTLIEWLGLDLTPIERARIGQEAESQAVGAQTGLLDHLSSLLGEAGRLLQVDFQSMETRTVAMPAGWCFVAVDSGVKHDLTAQYNDRRASCEAAARALGLATLRQATADRLAAHRGSMTEEAYGCASHVLAENERVSRAVESLGAGDAAGLGRLMFESHESSRVGFRNSCVELDELVAYARRDPRCVGARLSGGGFGGITIHLVRTGEAEAYRSALLGWLTEAGAPGRWSAVCQIDGGARAHRAE